MPSIVMNPNKVHFIHATPGLRHQTPSIKSFPQTEKALKDLEGMTLTDKEFLRYGYQITEFGYYELMKMRRCKACCVRIKGRGARSKAKLTPAEQRAEDARREAQNVITRAKLKEILPQITYHACPPPRFEGYGAQAEADYLRINPEVAAMYGIDEERVAASFAYEAANPGLRMPWPEFEEEERLSWKQAADGSWYGEAASPEVRDADDWENWEMAEDPQEAARSKEKPTGTHFIVHHIIIDHSLDYTQTAHIEMPLEICHWDLFKGGIAQSGKKAICQSHSEKPYYGIFPCCGERIGHPGCVQSNKHKSAWEYQYLYEDYKMFETEPGQAIDERAAIALDCEMGMTMRGESELIQVAAIDFFTGEILLDSLVLPDMPMRHLATRYSGVTWQMLRKAENNGTCLRGRDDARNRLMKFVGPKTIIVAHDGKADLLALRWIHKWVVDTYETESRIGVVRPVEEKKNLMHLAKVRLQRDIQQGRAHDCLQDCLACRDLGVFYVKTLPDEVKVRDEPPPREDGWEEIW